MTKGKYFREPDKFFAEPKPYGLGFTGSVIEGMKPFQEDETPKEQENYFGETAFVGNEFEEEVVARKVEETYEEENRVEETGDNFLGNVLLYGAVTEQLDDWLR